MLIVEMSFKLPKWQFLESQRINTKAMWIGNHLLGRMALFLRVKIRKIGMFLKFQMKAFVENIQKWGWIFFLFWLFYQFNSIYDWFICEISTLIQWKNSSKSFDEVDSYESKLITHHLLYSDAVSLISLKSWAKTM